MSWPNHLSPVVCGTGAPIREALERMNKAAHIGLPAGIVLVCEPEGKLVGVLTDGDLRRGLLQGISLDDSIVDAMQEDPITFPDDMSYVGILGQFPRVIAERDRYRSGVVDKIILTDVAGRPTRLMNFYEVWEHQVIQHRHIVVVGLGFVGLTISLVLAGQGFRVTGIEADSDVRAMLKAGEPHFHEVGIGPLLRECIDRTFVVEDQLPADGDVFLVAVGTPVTDTGEPDISYVRTAAEQVGERLRRGSLVVLRSTVPVGITRNEILPILEKKSGLRAGSDFHLAFAPERTVEGDALKELRELPQVVGALTPNCLDLAAALFAAVTPAVVRVDSLEEAELVKLVNNGFRDASFAFSNQIAQVCRHYNIDAHRLLHAANQGYPRNPLAKPSPGVGGICLEKDPYILSYVLRNAGIDDSVSLTGRRINESMPGHVVSWVEEALTSAGKEMQDCTILLAGIAFKGQPETSDTRGSPSLKILAALEGRCKEIRLQDPVVPAAALEAFGHPAVDLEDGFKGVDAALFLTNHLDYGRLDLVPLVESMALPSVLFDGWNMLDREIIRGVKGLIYLGLGHQQSNA